MTMPEIRLDDLIRLVHDRHPDGDPLQHLTDAVTLGDRLGELADHLIGHFVDQARKTGATWTEIGQSMGVSKQAAQKRFVPKPTDAQELLDAGPFSRFTSRARAVVVASQEAAGEAGHNYIGTEHIVLGLLTQPEGLAAMALAEQGITADQVRAAITVVLGPATDDVPRLIPFTARAKKVMELTIREALRLGHNYVGTEHLLLGVLADDEGAGAKVLTGLGLDRQRAERWILDQVARTAAPAGGDDHTGNEDR